AAPWLGPADTRIEDAQPLRRKRNSVIGDGACSIDGARHCDDLATLVRIKRARSALTEVKRSRVPFLWVLGTIRPSRETPPESGMVPRCRVGNCFHAPVPPPRICGSGHTLRKSK